MLFLHKNELLNSVFGLTDDFLENRSAYKDYSNLIHIFWNRSNLTIKLSIDSEPFELKPNQITTTTYLHRLDFLDETAELTAFSFNRDFYCIQDHDQEVSCNGIIFFGSQSKQLIYLEEEKHKYDLLYNVFIDEFETEDNIQTEMLRMLLKRLIIKTTRLAKKQSIPNSLKETQVEIIRQFNLLVDQHYRSKKRVSEYADLLNRSAKTLSNLFSIYNQKTPLQIIHERIILEAKRLLIYSNRSAKEIAFELGFDDVSVFHKLFKKTTKTSPQQFKISLKT